MNSSADEIKKTSQEKDREGKKGEEEDAKHTL
jgi:hypothetical protein